MLGGICVGLSMLAGCQAGLGPVAGPIDPASPLRKPQWRLLRPWTSVRGGFQLAPGPVMGTWFPPPGPFLALRSPVAAAARGTDLYIADAGHDAVFHYDVATDQMRRVLGSGARPGMKLCVFGDRSVLAFDPMFRRLTRLSRDGVQLARLQDPALLSGALDIALDDSSGMIWLADAAAARLLAVRPAMRAAVSVPVIASSDEAIGQLTALAAGPDALYAIEAARSRVLQLDAQGRVLQAFGDDVLRQPRAVAVDRHRRVYVIDSFDRSVHLFRGGRALARIAAPEIGAAELSDLRVHDDELAIADALGARVHLFRLLPEDPGS